MQKIYHKRNELLKVEFYQDVECTIPLDFTNAKNLYIDLKDGDCTPAIALSNKLFGLNLSAVIYTPCWYLGYRDNFNSKIILITLNDIQCDETGYKFNLSKYIPEDNAVLFLSREEYKDNEEQYIDMFALYKTEEEYLLAKEKKPNKNHFRVMAFWDEESKEILNNIDNKTKFTIFFSHGTQSELQKTNKVAKELKEKYGVDKVNVFVLRCFIPKNLLIKTLRPSKTERMYDDEIYGYKMQKICKNIDKIITTNSTGLLEPQDNEKLQVIDCFDIFNDAL